MAIPCLYSAQSRKGGRHCCKRVKRGLYRTASNQYINADCNGAANILKKVATTLGLDLREVGSGELITPLRVRFWTLKNPLALDKRAQARLS